MLRNLILFGSLIAAAAVSAQWVKQAPYPANDELQAVYFVSPEVGFISGAGNILMRTTDGGQTWSQAPGVARDPYGTGGEPIWHIQFLNVNDGFAMGNRGYRTNDGGATWQVLSLPDGAYDFDFLTPQRGWMFSRRGIYATSNAGTSWSDALPFSLNHFVMDVDFWSENNAVAVGRINNVYGTFRGTNGGQNWQLISAQTFDRVVFMTEQTLIATKGPEFFRSTDGGLNWTLTFNAFDSLTQAEVEAVTRISATSAAAISFDASIWITHDSGQTWTQVKEPSGTWGYELDIQFPTPEVGYAVGRAGIIWKSTDSGNTWTQISNGGARALFDVQMRPSGLGIAVGKDGMVVRTTDFGKKWTAFQMRGVGKFWHNEDLHTVEFINDNTIIVGGQLGRVFRSEDAGVTWTQLVTFGGNAEVFDTFFLNALEGWAAGTLNQPRGFIDHTTDGGLTWTRLVDGDPFPTRLHMFDANAGLSLIHARTQLRTANKFNNVTLEVLPSGESWTDMSFFGDSGFYGGYYGGILRTTNRGVSWTQSMLPNFDNSWDVLRDIDAMSEQKAYAAVTRSGGTLSGVVYETNNGGASWTTLPSIVVPDRIFASRILAIDALQDGPIWAVALDGYIFRYGEIATQVQPSGFSVVRGIVVSGGTLASVLLSDDERMVMRPGITLSSSQDPIVLEFTGDAGQASANELRLLVESSATSVNIWIKTEMYDYNAGAFVQVGATASTMTDTTQEFVRTDADRWISPTSEVKCRISYRANGPVIGFPWTSRLDMVRWQVQ